MKKMENNDTNGNGADKRGRLDEFLSQWRQIKISRRKVRNLIVGLSAVLVLIAVLTVVIKPSGGRGEEQPQETIVEEPKLMYGIEYERYRMEEKQVQSGETLSHMLDGYGLGQARINRIAEEGGTLLNARSINAGNKYVLFFESDSLGQEQLAHFVYEKNITDYVVFSFNGDEIAVEAGQKEVDIVRRKVTAAISSSLWNCIVEHDLPYALSCEMEDIYGWSVDFFALQEQDSFTVIYDEKYIDTLRVGIGRIWGAEFHHGGKTYYAIPFEQNDKISYWDENGNSLRKQLLKAPLKFTRISSKFSLSRMHPVLKIRRPHLGVDYAAPAGTPVVAIADGVVTRKGWDSGGGGNTLRLRHANNLESAYLHLKGYAKGISVGTRVSQGQLIGYVGSTGLSTGPHLDFRLYKGGTAIDPLKAPSEPTEPIKAENKAWFNSVKDRVLAELRGDVAETDKIMAADLESFVAAPDSLMLQAATETEQMTVVSDDVSDVVDEAEGEEEAEDAQKKSRKRRKNRT